MSRLIALLAFAEDRFPRVSGDEPELLDRLSHRLQFSPRERG